MVKKKGVKKINCDFLNLENIRKSCQWGWKSVCGFAWRKKTMKLFMFHAFGVEKKMKPNFNIIFQLWVGCFDCLAINAIVLIHY
jgi:hypothetical protein